MPEAVLRMGIIAPLGERCFSRQAPEDQNARIRCGDRGERGFAGQKIIPLPYGNGAWR
jgi:hypothetical protein